MGFFSRSGVSPARVSATGQHIRISNPWHAVEVRSSRQSCAACQQLAGLRFLSSEAPLLPIAGCEHPPTCRAVYKHHDDRREGPRREAELPGLARIRPAGPEGAVTRRIGRGRRSSDAQR